MKTVDIEFDRLFKIKRLAMKANQERVLLLKEWRSTIEKAATTFISQKPFPSIYFLLVVFFLDAKCTHFRSC